MSEQERVLHNILTATQAGTIIVRLAKTLNISTYEAFRRFMMSRTYAQFRTPGSIMSTLSDPAIVNEYLRETSKDTFKL